MNVPDVRGPAFDFDGHRRSALDAYQRVRPVYEAFADTVRSIVAQALNARSIKTASIEARAKSLESFADKAATPADENEDYPKYPSPLDQVTDLAGIRVITFFPNTVARVGSVLQDEFAVLERIDKGDLLIKEDRLGYQSLHYVLELSARRLTLSEYARFRGLKAEVQVRTILQHAWAEIEHDIQYKSVETIPAKLRRRFLSLAGLIEIADREFQAIQNEDELLRVQARESVAAGRLEQVEITPDALRAYLDRRLGPDGRMREWSYQSTAALLKRYGFTDFKQLDEALAGYDHDEISRSLWGGRQGQLTRFEDMLLAALGERFVTLHNLARENWWRDSKLRTLQRMRERGIPIRDYVPTPSPQRGADAPFGIDAK